MIANKPLLGKVMSRQPYRGRSPSSTGLLVMLIIVGLYLRKSRLDDTKMTEGDSQQYMIRGFEYFSDGSWSRISSLPPVGMQEGSGVRVHYKDPSSGSPRNEIWFAGGYPTDTGRVIVFDLDTYSWRIPPKQQLKWPMHHCLRSMFFDEKRCTIVILGGIKINNGIHQPNNAAITLNLCENSDVTWEEHNLPVGGIISCSVQTLLGRYWCYSGSNEYVNEEFKFFSFDLESLTVEMHESPKYGTTHVSILVDEERQLVYLTGGRDEGKNTVNKLLCFDVRAKSWSAEEIDIPFIGVEDRGYVQLSNKKALLFGGQSTGTINVVTDIILEFDFQSKTFSLVDESPLPLFGEQLVDMKNGSYFVFSGSSGVGPKYSRSAWMYHPQVVQTHVTKLGVPKVIDATCGSIPVTLALQTHLDSIVDRNKMNEPIYIPAAWCSEGIGPGNNNWEKLLTITFLRDNKAYRTQCEDTNACLLRP